VFSFVLLCEFVLCLFPSFWFEGTQLIEKKKEPKKTEKEGDRKKKMMQDQQGIGNL